jgi:hypothetical protein
MGGAMALAFLLAGSTSGGLPILLTVALAIAVGGKTAGVYGLDFFAQPIEAKLFQRVFAQGTPAATPHTA